MKKVLIVDDSLFMRQSIKSTLINSGKYEVVGEAATGDQGIELSLDLQPDIITMDNILPDMLGIDIIKELRKEEVTAKIIMVSAVGQESIINECRSSGADDYLVKPFSNESLIERIDKLALELN
ncbi:response regulator [Aurantibacillus circumpalustris]|uniref:response regulator n=1 Tax=Aurantibacillus circumpalustris TaxID=3036359 RepID=UPI00295B09D8|nr:response regulator [Aurantibacillus circumpalustris]